MVYIACKDILANTLLASQGDSCQVLKVAQKIFPHPLDFDSKACYYNSRKGGYGLKNDNARSFTGNNVKEFRMAAGLTRSELAKAVGISYCNLWRIEEKQTCPHDEVKVRIAQVLNKPVARIFFQPRVDFDSKGRESHANREAS